MTLLSGTCTLSAVSKSSLNRKVNLDKSKTVLAENVSLGLHPWGQSGFVITHSWGKVGSLSPSWVYCRELYSSHLEYRPIGRAF